MKYAAKLDLNNLVTTVITVGDDVTNVEEYCASKFGGNWKESFTDGTRKQSANVGHYYDAAKDKFLLIKPYPSWTLNENDDWQAPVTRPTQYQSQIPGAPLFEVEPGNIYNLPYVMEWDEENQRWTGFDRVNKNDLYIWNPETSTWSL